MAEQQKHIGLIGLGNMGSNIAEVLLRNEYSLTVYNQSSKKYSQFSDNGNVYCAKSLPDFTEQLQSHGSNATVWLMIPGGAPTNDMVHILSGMLEKNSIVVDGSNSEYSDSISNGKKLHVNGINYLDVGVAGGPSDVLKGVSLMVGGDKAAFERVKPVMEAVAGKGSYGYVGKSGSGHMLKAVHNAVFYATFPVYAEAVASISARQKTTGLDMGESLRLLGVAPPITTGIPDAILNAFRNGDFSKASPKSITVSKMVSSFVDNAEKNGVPLDLIKEILRRYPTMSEDTRIVYSGAKKILTGH